MTSPCTAVLTEVIFASFFMYLQQTESSIIIGPKFELTDFPILIQRHIEEFPGVPALEKLAVALVQVNFEFPQMENYIREVCRWGNFAGVGGRVIRNNEPQEIIDAFVEAHNYLIVDVPNVASALLRLNQLHSLGTPSFASKHLRFMKPELCPVYDSILTDKLPYAFTPLGYASFSKDCQVISNKLNAAAIGNPSRESSLWLAADVEAAMFASFYT